MRGKHYSKSHAVLSYYHNMESGAMTPGDVAVALNIPYPTYIKYVAGETACPAEVLARFYSVTGYLPVLQVLSPPDHRIVPISPNEPDKRSVEEEIMDDIIASTNLCQAWRAALADNRLDEGERRKILSLLEEKKLELDQTISIIKKYQEREGK